MLPRRTQLTLGGSKISLGFRLHGFVGAGEVEKVCHCFKRIVDLMCDGRSEATHCRQLLRTQEGSLSQLAVGNIDRQAAPAAPGTSDALTAHFQPVDPRRLARARDIQRGRDRSRSSCVRIRKSAAAGPRDGVRRADEGSCSISLKGRPNTGKLPLYQRALCGTSRSRGPAGALAAAKRGDKVAAAVFQLVQCGL